MNAVPRPLAVVTPTQVKRKARLLVVDDDPGLLRLLTIRLRAENYDVEAVESASAALAALLHETNAWLKLEAENRRLLATLDDRGRSQANSDKRAQTQAEEIARLRRALAEAQQKLDAVKEIERSFIERSPTPPGTRDANPSETQSPPPGR